MKSLLTFQKKSIFFLKLVNKALNGFVLARLGSDSTSEHVDLDLKLDYSLLMVCELLLSIGSVDFDTLRELL